MQLTTIHDYENGQNVIDGCMKEILEFVRRVFEQIKVAYRGVCDQSWKTENIEKIKDIQEKRNVLQEWKDVIRKKP